MIRRILNVTRRYLYLMVQPAGLIIYAGAQWLLFAYFLAKGGLTSGGDVALAQAIAAPVFAFLSLSLRQLWVSRREQVGDYGRLVLLRGATTLLAIVLVPAIALAARAHLALAPFAFVLFIKAQESLADIFYAGLDARGRSHVAGLLLGTKGAIIAAAMLAGLLFRLPVEWIGMVVALGCAAIVAVEMLLAAPRFNRGSWSLVQDWRGPTAPLAGVGWLSLANLLVAVTGFMPRYAIDLVSTRAVVGLFAAVSMPVTLLLLVATGLSQSSLLELSRAVDNRDRQSLIRVLVSRAAILAVLTWALAGTMILASLTPFPALFGIASSLLTTAGLVTILMTPAMVAQIVSYAYLPLRNFRTLSIINAMALVISAVFAWPLLRIHPIYGGAILACLPSLVQIAAFGWGLHRHFRIKQVAMT